MKIAIACSGLGHIRRGVEAWAEDVAAGLVHAGADVKLFRAAGAAESWAELVPVMKRGDKSARLAAQMFRHVGGWRYGCGSTYEVEQSSFSLGLWRRVRHEYDVLHVHDPLIAAHLTKLHKRGLSRPKVVIGNAVGIHPKDQRVYQYVQHLTPFQNEAWKPYAVAGQRTFVIPNFIDTDRFRPIARLEARRRWNLPEDAFIVLAVAALRKTFKRIDYLVREFVRFAAGTSKPVFLVLAGARERDTEEIVSFATEQLGARVRCFENLDRAAIQTLYSVADVFTIPALDEVFGIAFIEAMASGVPIVVHDTTTMRWIGGPAALYRDISQEGSLANAFLHLSQDPTSLSQLSAQARPHVENTFSKRAVIPQIMNLYQSIGAGA